MEIVRYRTIEYEQQIWRLKKRIFYRPRLNVIEMFILVKICLLTELLIVVL